MTKLNVLAGVGHKSATLNQEGISVNILHEDVCLPAVVVKCNELENNIAWMQHYSNVANVSLPPHGKTTMTPAIFKRQIAQGAWGLSVGTAYQAKVAVESGVQNIIIANQVVGKTNIRLLAELVQLNQANIYCCVDSVIHAKQLAAIFSSLDLAINVLIELGVNGGRCGCRSEEEAIILANELTKLPSLMIAGIEFYEGVIHSDDAQKDIEEIQQFLQRVLTTSQKLDNLGVFARYSGELLITGAGSVWYDLVSKKMAEFHLSKPIRFVIRPGCYITHDHGIYDEAQKALKVRDSMACQLDGDLMPAMEIVALIQSVPERGRAIVNFGKRDVAFDAGLPQPLMQYREGKPVYFQTNSAKTVGLMDQHAILSFDENCDFQVGDILVFGTSHPCITFDKWKVIYLVDDKYDVIEEMPTFF
ncbi:amino acid deaminase [Providencia rettgeri]